MLFNRNKEIIEPSILCLSDLLCPKVTFPCCLAGLLSIILNSFDLQFEPTFIPGKEGEE